MAAKQIAAESDYARVALADDSEFAHLVDCVVATVTTRFFRDTVPFETLGRLVGDGVLPRDGLRVLCLPCSTGEEAYSIAITLLNAGRSPESFTVDAVDVKRGRIEFARRNCYEAERVREVPAGLLARFFVRVADQFQVVGDVAKRVRFWADSVTRPECLPGVPTYDLVFCKNLMVYLSREARALAWSHIRSAAKPGCVFCITPHEEAFFPGLEHADGASPWAGFRRLSGAVQGW